jgi:hypothetical protein
MAGRLVPLTQRRVAPEVCRIFLGLKPSLLVFVAMITLLPRGIMQRVQWGASSLGVTGVI